LNSADSTRANSAITAGRLPWCVSSCTIDLTPGISRGVVVPGVQADRDDAGRIAFERQPHQAEDVLRMGDEPVIVLHVLGLGLAGLGLGPIDPVLGCRQALLEIADGGEVLVELLAVPAPTLASKRLGALAQAIQEAAIGLEPLMGGELGLRGVLDEQLLVELHGLRTGGIIAPLRV
jgi:hypothetical protein